MKVQEIQIHKIKPLLNIQKIKNIYNNYVKILCSSTVVFILFKICVHQTTEF